MKKIVAINLGSTSTKVAYYEDETCIFNENINHPTQEIKAFAKIWDQQEYRRNAIIDLLKRKGIHISDLDAMATRGGHTIPIEGGTYRVTDTMLEMSASEKYGNHATDLGLKLVKEFSQYGPQPFTVDPPVTDEFEPLARYTGIPFMKRRSSFHILNHRAVGQQYAKDKGIPYDEMNLVVVHMGGGISIAAHKNGKLIDGNNALDGDGPFSTNRCCTVPVGDLAKLCFSGAYTYEEVKKLLNGNSGLVAYTGTADVKTIQKRAADGDQTCAEALDAMCYQIAKEVGAYATVLSGKVDAILLTGGIAYSDLIVNKLKERVEYIAPVVAYPGEYEMQSLALNTLGALNGKVVIKEIQA